MNHLPHDRSRRRFLKRATLAGAVIDGALVRSPSPCPSPIEGRAVKFRFLERVFDALDDGLSLFRRRTMPLLEVIPDPDRETKFTPVIH